jgi:putative PIN family toxin of toxin-antitoxin system
MRIVLDTNVLVSAILGGATSEILAHWKQGSFDLVVTADILDEYLAELQRPKFNLPVEVIEDIAAYLYRNAIFVVPQEPISVVEADPKDNRFLEAAIAGEANVVVSGDRHLLEFGTFRGIPIVGARTFLDMQQ